MSRNLQSNSDLMVDIFSQYEQQYTKALASASRKIEVIDTQSNTKKELVFADIKRQLTNVEKSLKYMEMEISNFPPQLKTEYQIKARKYRKEFDESRRKLHRIENNYVDEKNKQQLMGGGFDEQSQNGRERFIKQGELMSHATHRLKQSVRTIRQTEEISNAVQIELVSHTQKMSRMIEKPKQIKEDLTESQYFVKKIGMNIKKNKLILGAVAGIVLLIIIIIVWVVIAKRT